MIECHGIPTLATKAFPTFGWPPLTAGSHSGGTGVRPRAPGEREREPFVDLVDDRVDFSEWRTS